MKDFSWLPFRPKTDEEISLEEQKEKTNILLKEAKQRERLSIFKNEASVELLKEWTNSCGFMDSTTYNSARTTAGNMVDPYKIVFYDGMKEAIKIFFGLVDVDNELLTTILKK
jgi:hypothetical protein